MARLTTVKAAHHLRYCEREIALGRGTPRLEEIAAHRRAYIIRSKACIACGTPLSREDSIEAWSLDFLGPDCRARLASRQQVAS